MSRHPGSDGSPGWLTPARKAELIILGVAIAWGLSFPLIKIALASATPFAFMALRFPLAFILLWPLLGWRRPARSSLLAGMLLALLLGVSYLAQVIGLVHTTPTRSAFITGLSVILVPLFYPLITRRRPGTWPVIGAVIALGGLYLLTDPGAGGLNRGDLITLVTAVGYALYIIVLEVTSKRHPHEDLVLLQLLPMSLVFAPAAVLEGAPVAWSPGLLWALLFTGPILALTLYLQNRYQRDTTASRAAVIFTGEPVFASLFAFWLTGDVLGGTQWLGALLILIGILTALRRSDRPPAPV